MCIYLSIYLFIHLCIQLHLYLSIYLSLSPPDVQVPGVVLVMGDVDPVVVCDHPLVQAQDRLVTSLMGNIFGTHKIFLKGSPSP